MSWAIGYDCNWKRDVGYGVPATCDHPGCDAEIDRGLVFVCGSEPYGGEHGCGLFFCRVHRRSAGENRGVAELCARCYQRKEPFKPAPDSVEWIRHKLTDESWAKWRETNREAVEALISSGPEVSGG